MDATPISATEWRGLSGRFSAVAVVLAFNRHELLRKCLAAIENQALPPSDVVVVDNGSDIPIGGMLSREFPNVMSVRLPSNTGSAVGFGVGIKHAVELGPDWVWIMDDDAEPHRDCLRILAEAAPSLPDSASIIAPLVVSHDGGIQVYHRGTFSPVRQLQLPVKDPTSGTQEIGYCSFLGPLISSAAIRATELPNKDYFMWWDDVEYSMRLAKRGPMYQVPEARIYHSDEATSLRSDRLPPPQWFKIYYGVRNRVLVMRAVEPSRWRRSLGYLYAIFRSVKTGFALLVFHPPGALTRVHLVFRGLLDGFRGRVGKVIDPQEWASEHPAEVATTRS